VKKIGLTQEYRGSYGVNTGLFSFGGDVPEETNLFLEHLLQSLSKPHEALKTASNLKNFLFSSARAGEGSYINRVLVLLVTSKNNRVFSAKDLQKLI
jgi:hypothetical protein